MSDELNYYVSGDMFDALGRRVRSMSDENGVAPLCVCRQDLGGRVATTGVCPVHREADALLDRGRGSMSDANGTSMGQGLRCDVCSATTKRLVAVGPTLICNECLAPRTETPGTIGASQEAPISSFVTRCHVCGRLDDPNAPENILCVDQKMICTTCFDARSAKTDDPVNHPAHYTSGGIECIDALEAALGTEGFVAFCRGSVIQYAWRAPLKGNAAPDLRKAAWYAERAATCLEKEKP